MIDLRRTVGLVALVLASSSCITPWVVAPVRNAAFTLENSGYPDATRIVELERDGEPTLRGIFVADASSKRRADAAPQITNEVRFLEVLVVHFAESGGSIVHNSENRRQYEQCLEYDFASLALDYQGVGLSDGNVSPRDLDTDALAIYAHALELVGGNESRLILRGCSIGTLAIASILESGARPGAVVLFAPVLAESVGLRYGQVIMWDPMAAFASLFMRSIMSARLVDELAQVDTRLIVFAYRLDELVNDDEFDRLKSAVKSVGGIFAVPKQLPLYEHDGIPRLRQFKNHVGLAASSYSLQQPERELYESMSSR